MESKFSLGDLTPPSEGPRLHSPHVGSAVRVGQYQVLTTGTQYKNEEHFGDRFDDADVILVPLTKELPGYFGCEYRVLWAPLEDFGGVPHNWEVFLRENIIPRLEDGQILLAYCAGSHGRTGTFLASLIALLETPEETPDPIAAARERHCDLAVETLMQARGIFALRGQAVPQKYIDEFTPQKPVKTRKIGSTAIVAATKSV